VGKHPQGILFKPGVNVFFFNGGLNKKNGYLKQHGYTGVSYNGIPPGIIQQIHHLSHAWSSHRDDSPIIYSYEN
jgi:hypothetical protein